MDLGVTCPGNKYLNFSIRILAFKTHFFASSHSTPCLNRALDLIEYKMKLA